MAMSVYQPLDLVSLSVSNVHPLPLLLAMRGAELFVQPNSVWSVYAM